MTKASTERLFLAPRVPVVEEDRGVADDEAAAFRAIQ